MMYKFEYNDGTTPWDLNHASKKRESIFHSRKALKDLCTAIPSYSKEDQRQFESPAQAPSSSTPQNFSGINRDNEGNTALHLAVENGNVREVTELLAANSFLAHTKNNQGRTPLHIAAVNSSTNNKDLILIIELLIAHRTKPHEAFINDTDNQKQTPLDLAAQFNRNRPLVLQTLKKHGATTVFVAESTIESTLEIFKAQEDVKRRKKSNEFVSREDAKDAVNMLNIFTIRTVTSAGLSESGNLSLWQSQPTKDAGRDVTVDNPAILKASISFKRNPDGSTNETNVCKQLNNLTNATKSPIFSSFSSIDSGALTYEYSLEDTRVIKELADSYKKMCAPIQEYLDKNPSSTIKHSRQETASHLIKKIKNHTSPRSLAIELYQYYVTLKGRNSSLCGAIEQTLSMLLGIDKNPCLDKAELIAREMKKQYQYEFNLTATEGTGKQIRDLYDFIHSTESYYKYKIGFFGGNTARRDLVVFARSLIDHINGNKTTLRPKINTEGYTGSVVEKIYNTIVKPLVKPSSERHSHQQLGNN